MSYEKGEGNVLVPTRGPEEGGYSSVPTTLFLQCGVLAQKLHRKERNLAEVLKEPEQALCLKQSSVARFQETVEHAFGQ